MVLGDSPCQAQAGAPMTRPVKKAKEYELPWMTVDDKLGEIRRYLRMMETIDWTIYGELARRDQGGVYSMLSRIADEIEEIQELIRKVRR